jgi:beta-xylosidase
LYENALLPACADPGVVRDGDRYVVVCTSGNASNAFPMQVSTDLVHWTAMGHIFPSAKKPTWAKSDYWAPEIHKVGSGYVAYFTARDSDGKLSIGAASSASATGPFADLGHPLLHDAAMGLIDASEFEAPDGKKYLLWKEDGNAVGKPTPIHAQPLAADGLSLTGSAATLITNDQSWEGAVVEGPWMVAHGGMFYLFYSGNSYANATYAVGVARATAPLGPYTKATAPIVTTNAAWIGPGHNSIVDGPGGDSYMVYHAWLAGHVNGPGDARLGLVDRLVWSNGWPALPGGPSTSSRPMP